MSHISPAARVEHLIVNGSRWLSDVARVQSPDDHFTDLYNYPVVGYTGAVRNEYDTKTRSWYLNGPVWHTGQAIRAVLLSYSRSGDQSLLDAARAMGDYVIRNVVSDPNDANRGLLLAYEGDNITVNNEVVLETLPGLLDLYRVTGDRNLLDTASTAADFVLQGFDPSEGLITDHYHVAEQRFVSDPDNAYSGRIALDDAALVELSELTDKTHYRDAFLAMAERALREEDPPGTWIVFPPWHRDTRRMHIRTTWWWGYPLLTAYDLTKEQRFLDAGIRAGQWYLDQQNPDGGFYYAATTDGRHPCFALATSGSAVSTIIWADLYRRTGDERYRVAIHRSLSFFLATQFNTENDDPNVHGALWETLNVPDHSTAPGFRIRDIATIFTIRAGDALLKSPNLLPDEVQPLSNRMVW